MSESEIAMAFVGFGVIVAFIFFALEVQINELEKDLEEHRKLVNGYSKQLAEAKENGWK